jgi:hypothetical protein
LPRTLQLTQGTHQDIQLSVEVRGRYYDESYTLSNKLKITACQRAAAPPQIADLQDVEGRTAFLVRMTPFSFRRLMSAISLAPDRHGSTAAGYL